MVETSEQTIEDGKEVDSEELIIDLEFRKVIPPHDPQEIQSLRESLITEGQRDDIITWNHIIIDGHTRYDLLKELGMPRRSKETPIKFLDREAVKNWIRENQASRRNLSDLNKADNLGQIFAYRKNHPGAQVGHIDYAKTSHDKPVEEGAKEATSASFDNQPEATPESNKTRDKMADEFNVSASTIRNDAALSQAINIIVEKTGIDREELKNGLRLDQKAIKTIAKFPVEYQEEAIEKIRGLARKTSKTVKDVLKPIKEAIAREAKIEEAKAKAKAAEEAKAQAEADRKGKLEAEKKAKANAEKQRLDAFVAKSSGDQAEISPASEEEGPETEPAATEEPEPESKVETGAESEPVSRQTIQCGDFLDPDVEVPERKVDIVITSQSFNLGLDYGPESNDALPEEEYDAFVEKFLKRLYVIMRDGGRLLLDVPIDENNFCNKGIHKFFSGYMVDKAEEAGFRYRNVVIWNPNSGNPNSPSGSYCEATAPSAFACGNMILQLYKGEWKRATKGTSTITAPEWKAWAGSRGIWADIPKVLPKDVGHPAPMPVEVVSRLLKIFSFLEDGVFDPFVGSGTTIVACAQLGRKAIGVEINPRYVELAKSRLILEGHPDGEKEPEYESEIDQESRDAEQQLHEGGEPGDLQAQAEEDADAERIKNALVRWQNSYLLAGKDPPGGLRSIEQLTRMAREGEDSDIVALALEKFGDQEPKSNVEGIIDAVVADDIKIANSMLDSDDPDDMPEDDLLGDGDDHKGRDDDIEDDGEPEYRNDSERAPA